MEPQEKEENPQVTENEAEEGADSAEDEAAEAEAQAKGIVLPFPKATIVNMMRRHLDSGKQIKGPVKVEMNAWLGKMVQRVSAKMNEHPYSYVDASMFREAVEPYENIQDIEKEKERIIKQLESVKAACDVLINEVDRKFVK